VISGIRRDREPLCCLRRLDNEPVDSVDPVSHTSQPSRTGTHSLFFSFSSREIECIHAKLPILSLCYSHQSPLFRTLPSVTHRKQNFPLHAHRQHQRATHPISTFALADPPNLYSHTRPISTFALADPPTTCTIRSDFPTRYETRSTYRRTNEPTRQPKPPTRTKDPINTPNTARTIQHVSTPTPDLPHQTLYRNSINGQRQHVTDAYLQTSPTSSDLHAKHCTGIQSTDNVDTQPTPICTT
jgi:hypothetical protein